MPFFRLCERRELVKKISICDRYFQYFEYLTLQGKDVHKLYAQDEIEAMIKISVLTHTIK